MRIYNIVNIDFGTDRLKEFCVNNFNSISASIKSIISQVRINKENIAVNATTLTDCVKISESSSEYTPTATIITNLTSCTPTVDQWAKIGNRVWVSGYVTIQPTATGVLCTWRHSLPFSSNFSLLYDCEGSGCARQNATPPLSIAGETVSVEADTTNNEAFFTYYPTTLSSKNLFYMFMYKIA